MCSPGRSLTPHETSRYEQGHELSIKPSEAHDVSQREFPMKLEIVTPDRDILGESAVWSARDAALFWVDIRRRLLRRLHPASRALTDWPLSEPPGSVAIRARGGVILALTSGLSAFCPEGNQLQLL